MYIEMLFIYMQVQGEVLLGSSRNVLCNYCLLIMYGDQASIWTA